MPEPAMCFGDVVPAKVTEADLERVLGNFGTEDTTVMLWLQRLLSLDRGIIHSRLASPTLRSSICRIRHPSSWLSLRLRRFRL